MKVQHTFSPRPRDIEHRWHLIDAAGQTVGRLATRIAQLLRGKHKAGFAPHMKMGDYVVVINAAKVKVTGKKTQDKAYIWHTGWPGGLRQRSFTQMRQEHPERVIQYAVRGMLPHTALGRDLLSMLKVYAGAEHPHEAQLKAGVMKPAAAWAPARPAEKKAAEAMAPAAEAVAAAPARAEAPEVAAPAPERRAGPTRRAVRTLAERETRRRPPAKAAETAPAEEASTASPEPETPTTPERGEEKS